MNLTTSNVSLYKLYFTSCLCKNNFVTKTITANEINERKTRMTTSISSVALLPFVA